MKDQILLNLDNPAQLERLYREDKPAFKHAFQDLYPQMKNNTLIEYWNARLNYVREEIAWGSRRELVFVILGALLAGIIAKLPAIFSLNEEVFYSRNIGFTIFPVLTAYFAWKRQLSNGKLAIIGGVTLLGLVFINLLPRLEKSDTIILSCIHLLIILWSMLGFAFAGTARNEPEKRLRYLKYNGDLVVMTTLILIAGGIMTGVTIGLFELIGIRIEQFYFENVVIFGLPAAPILGTYLTQNNPQLVGKVSPVIAKIFSPLVMVMLVVYLSAIIYSGKNPYNNREFLMMFNVLLVGVLAIIFFSVAETSGTKSVAQVWVLFLLSALTIIVNGVALSAILFRISEWGLTPNRAAVLGGNILILIHLILVTIQLTRVVFKKTDILNVGKSISLFLPAYCIWATIVVFLFPFLFNMQ